MRLQACQFHTVSLMTSGRGIGPLRSLLPALTWLKCSTGKRSFYPRNSEKLHALKDRCVTCKTEKRNWLNWGIAASSWCTKIEYIQPTPFVVWCWSATVRIVAWRHRIKSKQWQGHTGISHVCGIPLKRQLLQCHNFLREIIIDWSILCFNSPSSSVFMKDFLLTPRVLSNQTYKKNHVFLCF